MYIMIHKEKKMKRMRRNELLGDLKKIRQKRETKPLEVHLQPIIPAINSGVTYECTVTFRMSYLFPTLKL